MKEGGPQVVIDGVTRADALHPPTDGVTFRSLFFSFPSYRKIPQRATVELI